MPSKQMLPHSATLRVFNGEVEGEAQFFNFDFSRIYVERVDQSKRSNTGRELLIATVDNLVLNGENVHITANIGAVALASLYGAAAQKFTASLETELLTAAQMTALIYSTPSMEAHLRTASRISENMHIVGALELGFKSEPEIGKNTPVKYTLKEAISQFAFPSKDYHQPAAFFLTVVDGHVTTTIFDTLYAAFNVAVPPGSTLVIDSDNYLVLLNGQNITYAHSGKWLHLTRDVHDILIDCPTEHTLQAEILYIERYL